MISKILKDGIIIKAQPKIIEGLSQKAPDEIMEIKQWSSLDPKLDKTIITSRIRKNADFIKSEILSRKIEELD